MTGDNGLLTKAGEAKNATEIAEEKDIISISAIQAQSENKYGNLEESKFSEALNTNSKTENKASIIAEDIGSFTVKFESNRYYEVNKNGNISYIENATGEKTLTIQCVNSKNEVLGEYEYTIVTDRYSKLPPTINKYESSEEKIEGEITENKTIQVLYFLICNDDTTLVFTGLDSSGNITTNENEIASYMIGDGSSTSGNGLKEKKIKAILKIPEMYNGKPTIKINTQAFRGCWNIIRATTGDSIEKMGANCFCDNSIENIIIGKNVKVAEGTVFFTCPNLKSVTFKCDIIAFSGLSFYNCKSFEEIKLEGNENKYTVEDNILYSADGKNLILCPNGKKGEIIVKEGVETINAQAFRRCFCFSSVILPESVITISNQAFIETGFSNIKIGKNVETVGNQAFYLNYNLNNITIDSPTIVKQINSKTAMNYLINNLPDIYIKNDITEIGGYITENYQIIESDKEGYVKYVKK